MTPTIVSAPSAADLVAGLLAAGVLEAAEQGTAPAPGVVYSFMGVHQGLACALVDLSSASPGLQASAAAALAALAAAPGVPPRMVLGGAPPVRSVSPASWRLALLEAGLYDAANALIAQAGTQAQVVYEFSNRVLRDHPLLASMAQALGKTDADIEAVFVRAEQLDRGTVAQGA